MSIKVKREENNKEKEKGGFNFQRKVEKLPRVIGLFKFVAIAYMLTCGGPFGIEDSVAAAGLFPTLVGILVFPIIWALPQALMAAEMSTLLPSNGGSVIWVQESMGNLGGWVYSFNALLTNFFDQALFPALSVDYLRPMLDLNWVWSAGIKVLFVFLGCLCNIFGLESVSWLEFFLTLIMLFPFVAEIVILILNPSDLTNIDHFFDIQTNVDYSLFLSTLLWSFTGWTSLGTFAGEVNNVKKTYPRGVVLTLVLNILNFVIPICVGYLLLPDLTEWTSGAFSKVAFDFAPWLGYSVFFGSLVSNFGQFNADIAVCSRMTWVMAFGHGMEQKLPRFIGWTWKRFTTPVVSIIVNCLVTCALFSLPFQILVQYDIFFNCVCLLMEFYSFMYFKYRLPDPSVRPYAVPGKKWGAWAITIPKVSVVIITAILSDYITIAVAICANLIILAAFFARQLWLEITLAKKQSAAPPPDTIPLIDPE